jgi:ABC-type multidrug transport system fused ATPase/permease subunit
VDVVLLLVIFFMLSTTFIQDSRLRVELPEAGVQRRIERSMHPIIITISAQGSYRVNDRALVNNERATLSAALRQVAGRNTREPVTIRADAARDPPIGRDCDGRRRPAGIHAGQHCDRQPAPGRVRRGRARRARRPAHSGPTCGCWPTRARTGRCSLLGVLGMVMYASVDTGIRHPHEEIPGRRLRRARPAHAVIVPAGIVVLFVVRGVGDYLSVYAPGWVGRQVIKSLRHDLFARYLQMPVSFFDRNGVAPLLSRLTYNIEMVAEAATNAVTFIIRDTLTIVGLVAYLIYLNWKLTLFALAVGPIAVGLIRATSHLFRRYSARIQSSMGDVARVAKESLESQRMIKVFNAEEQQLSAFEEVNELNRASFMKLITVKAVSNPVVQMFASLGLAAVMYMALRDVIQEGKTVGSFTSFLVALLMVSAPLRRLVSVLGPAATGHRCRPERVRGDRFGGPRIAAATSGSSARAAKWSTATSASLTRRKRAAC